MKRVCYIMIFPLVVLCYVIGRSIGLPLAPSETTVNVRPVEPAGANRPPLPPRLHPSMAGIYVTIDHSPTNHCLLLLHHPAASVISKTNWEESIAGDLWLQAEDGQKRFVAGHVVQALFSPMGNKVAYSTRQEELFVETLTGERLAWVPRVRDVRWQSDYVLSFSAFISADYPDLVHPAIYDLSTGRVFNGK